MNTHLIMYANVQESARRSTETWHYPRTHGPRSHGRVWTTLRDLLRPSDQVLAPTPAPATGFAATASLMTAFAWL